MTIKEKIQRLKDFKNEKEFREFLIDFLKKCGFRDIIHTHRYGSPEQGKDIIAKFPHSLEGDDWYAFVVKLGRIGGGTNEIEIIKNQISQSFEYNYVGINGEEVKINKVKVVTNENFTVGAQTQISSSAKLKLYNNFNFWWNENLIQLIDDKYSDFWLPGDVFSKEYSKSFMKSLQEEIEIRELSIRKIDDKKIQKLLDIFVEPKLTVDSLEENKKTKEKSVKQKVVKVSSINEINENLVLSGEQGAGKTKILNTIACNLSSAERISKTKLIPVKIKAPKFYEENFEINDVIKEQVKFFSDEFFKENILDDYKVILFIDDLDLLKTKDKEKFVGLIKEYCKENRTNYVITYRKNEFDYDQNVETIRIHNFDNKQVELFISKFFEGTDRGKKFIDVLKQSDILSKLPTTPLTITLISLLYDENSFEIPATLTDIYIDFTSILLGKLEVKNKGELLIYNLRRRLFSFIALKMLDSKIFEMPFNDYKNSINEFLKDRGYEAQSDEEIIDIVENSGLLYKDDSNTIGFKQQAFIEFFASSEVYHHKRETYYKKMVKQFNDVNWQSTAIFYAGHSKELDGMIDDVIKLSPNNNLKDWLINSGGMGYLAQALYQTTPSERKKLVLNSADNLTLSFTEIKKLSKFESSQFFGMPLPFMAAIMVFWFHENFKSITLKNTLIESFNYLFQSENNFENNFKLLMISSTLMNPYLDYDDCFGELIERKEFIDHPVLPLIADVVMELGSIDKKSISKEKKDKIEKAIKKKREYLKSILKEPAYRFNDDFSLGK